MLADKNSFRINRKQWMKYRIDTPLVCKYGPQTVDLVPIMLRTSPKFGEDQLILRFLAKIVKKKKWSKIF